MSLSYLNPLSLLFIRPRRRGLNEILSSFANFWTQSDNGTAEQYHL